MGTKILSLQMMRWFFHLMGIRSQFSCMVAGMRGKTAATVKLIRSDGVVKIYDRPIPVSELMSEFPKHMVCGSDSFYIGQKIDALSEHDRLRPGHSYFLLPNHLFQSVLSFVTITSFIASSQCHSALHLKRALVKGGQPFQIQKTPSGYLRVNVSEEFISQLIEEGKAREDDEDDGPDKASGRLLICTTRQLQKDYNQLVGPRHHWKPKLETIKEAHEKRKIASPCPIKRARKKSHASLQTQKTHQRPRAVVQYSSSPSSGYSKQISNNNKIKVFLAASRKQE